MKSATAATDHQIIMEAIPGTVATTMALVPAGPGVHPTRAATEATTTNGATREGATMATIGRAKVQG